MDVKILAPGTADSVKVFSTVSDVLGVKMIR